MLRDIIRKEIMDNISTMKFVVTFAVVVVLVISGIAIGARDYTEKKADALSQPERSEKTLEGQTNWLAAGYIGIFDAKMPYVLSIFDHGIDNSLGRTSQLSLSLDANPDESRNLLSPILAIFGEVDLTFVVKIILSLFVILLTYDAISGEKERGTLKLTLSNEVSRSTYIIGKIIGGFSVIGISFILPLVLGLAFMMGFYPEVLADFDAEAWMRLAIIVLVYLIYLGLFFAVGLFVSSMCQKSSTSFIVLLMIWVLFVTIVPRVSLTVAEKMKPYQSYATMQTLAGKEVAAEIRKSFDAFKDRQKLMKAIQNKEAGKLFADIFEDVTKRQQAIMAKYDEEFKRQQDSQILLAESLSRSISPTSALTFAVQNLSGTGYNRQKDYIKQLREFQAGYRKMVLQRIANIKDIQEIGNTKNIDVKPQEVTFNYIEEPAANVINRTLWDIAVLVIMTLMFFVASFVLFMRYDVR
jgi:ABC-type transport system involved in multi-copper enzyme maturation permease subunit